MQEKCLLRLLTCLNIKEIGCSTISRLNKIALLKYDSEQTSEIRLNIVMTLPFPGLEATATIGFSKRAGLKLVKNTFLDRNGKKIPLYWFIVPLRLIWTCFWVRPETELSSLFKSNEGGQKPQCWMRRKY